MKIVRSHIHARKLNSPRSINACRCETLQRGWLFYKRDCYNDDRNDNLSSVIDLSAPIQYRRALFQTRIIKLIKL